jgi:hypothetical protein
MPCSEFAARVFMEPAPYCIDTIILIHLVGANSHSMFVFSAWPENDSDALVPDQ